MPQLPDSRLPFPNTLRSVATSALSGPSGSDARANIKAEIPKATAIRRRLDTPGRLLYDLAAFLEFRNVVQACGRWRHGPSLRSLRQEDDLREEHLPRAQRQFPDVPPEPAARSGSDPRRELATRTAVHPVHPLRRRHEGSPL